ncbi:MAG: NYN domain-containing protein [Acidobacteria bacterium]|nr:NYN domain-containing protein [Acidobacteriota bacterium]
MLKPGQPLKTVNVYIDGYNFYYSINRSATLNLGWCNFLKLAERLAARAFEDRYVVGAVKYYTSKVGNDTEMNPGEIKRRNLWLAALENGTDGKVVVVEGYHKKDPQKIRVEKQTDTNIAIGMIRDALLPRPSSPSRSHRGPDFHSPCDAVLLVSGDNDFLPALAMIGNEYGRDVAVFHPHDDNRSERRESWGSVFKIDLEDLAQSRLDDVIELPSGGTITWAEYLRLKQRPS